MKVPFGCILNPRPPAPVRARMLPCYRAYDAVMKALAQVVPGRAIASGFDNAHVDLSFGLVRDRAGAVTGALAIGRDATARRAVEEALRARVVELERQLEAMVSPRVTRSDI